MSLLMSRRESKMFLNNDLGGESCTERLPCSFYVG